jgi:hypothetical protein
MNNETQILAAKLLTQILASGEKSPETGANSSEILARLDEMNSPLCFIRVRSVLRLEMIWKMKRLAALNRAASLVIIARCAVRAGFEII